MSFIQNQFEKNFLTTSVDYVFNWARKSAIWPLTFGLACCAIEMIASSTSRFDIARFGSEVFRPSPRQSDLMIVAGTVTLKMAPVLKRIWDQMPDPKWCISMGACSSVGGPFNTYAVLQGVDRIVPVDVYVTGCPPRLEVSSPPSYRTANVTPAWLRNGPISNTTGTAGVGETPSGTRAFTCSTPATRAGAAPA